MAESDLTEVERLLQEEMAELGAFYDEFGEEDIQEMTSIPNQQSQIRDAVSPEKLLQPTRDAGKGLPVDTQFMKSGDFFEYIENVVGQDQVIGNQIEQMMMGDNEKDDQEEYNMNERLDYPDERDNYIDEEPEINRKEEHVRDSMLYRSRDRHNRNEGSNELLRQSRDSNQVNRQSWDSKQGMESSLNQLKKKNDRRDSPQEKNDWKERERQTIKGRNRFRNNDAVQESFDERVIPSKKKTFEEMLEEALQKEGMSKEVLDIDERPEDSKVKPNFLKKKNRRMFLNKKTKKKLKKEDKKMTESMLEFEQNEKGNSEDSLEVVDDELEEKVSIEQPEEEEDEESEGSDEEVKYEYLKMGKRDKSQEKERDSNLKKELERVRKEVEAKFSRKIKELNTQIRKFKDKNKSAEDEKRKLTKMKKKMETDKVDRDKLKAEKDDFEKYREKEREKLKREKTMTKRNAKAYRATTNKKDR